MSISRIRKVETRYANRAKTPGGIGLTQAVAAAEIRLETMRESGHDAIIEMLADLLSQRKAIAASDGAAFAALWGQADSLAGLAEIFGMPEVGRAALSLCQLFDAAAPAFPSPDAVQVHLDALLMFRALGPDAATASAPSLLHGLEQVVAAARRNAASS